MMLVLRILFWISLKSPWCEGAPHRRPLLGPKECSFLVRKSESFFLMESITEHKKSWFRFQLRILSDNNDIFTKQRTWQSTHSNKFSTGKLNKDYLIVITSTRQRLEIDKHKAPKSTEYQLTKHWTRIQATTDIIYNCSSRVFPTKSKVAQRSRSERYRLSSVSNDRSKRGQITWLWTLYYILSI